MPMYEFQVHAHPQYLPEESAPEAGLFSFGYTITVTNTGSKAAQLIARHWQIEDVSGYTEEVKGLGVVGRQPLLQPGESFRYSSGCRLHAPKGSMQGSYFCVAEDGEHFHCPIARFALDASDALPGARTLH